MSVFYLAYPAVTKNLNPFPTLNYWESLHTNLDSQFLLKSLKLRHAWASGAGLG